MRTLEIKCGLQISEIFRLISNYKFLILSVQAKGLESLWIIGDKFCAENSHVLIHQLKQHELYVKQNFELKVFYSRVPESGNCARSNTTRDVVSNCISRIHNTVVAALSRHAQIPKMMVVVLENDIINFLEYQGYGVTEMYGKVIEYLTKELQNTVIRFRNRYLPSKAFRSNWPQFIYITPSIHDSYKDNILRKKFTTEMNALLQNAPATLTLRFKQIWNPENKNLVSTEGTITSAGVKSFWLALDKTIKFADHRLFRNYNQQPLGRAVVLPYRECTL